MPRRARLLLPGYPLHLIQRSHNRQPCFFHRFDYIHYLEWLHEYARSHGAAIHAYVLMTNHIHLLASLAGTDEKHRSELRPICESVPRTLRQRVARPVLFLARDDRPLFPDMPALHRTQPSTRGHGRFPGWLSLVELQEQCGAAPERPGNATCDLPRLEHIGAAAPRSLSKSV